MLCLVLLACFSPVWWTFFETYLYSSIATLRRKNQRTVSSILTVGVMLLFCAVSFTEGSDGRVFDPLMASLMGVVLHRDVSSFLLSSWP